MTTGLTITMDPDGSNEDIILRFGDSKVTEPGVCVLWTQPSIGDASDRNSPANVAATALYTNVRYMNSGRKNYDQADLMIYGLTAADLYSFINWMIRIYNCAYMFSQRNVYIGKSLLEAQGVSPSIIEDLPAFRYWINVFINKVASYAVPDDIYLYRKRAFMYSSIYSESAEGTIKDQLYMYNPSKMYRFTLDDHEKGCLELIDIKHGIWNRDSDDLLTLQGLRAIGDYLLSDMWGDEDFGIMAGDILRAFDGKIVALSPVGEEGGILPVYDPYVLHQMKNSVVVDLSDDHSNKPYRINLGTPDNPEWQYCNNGEVYQDAKGNLVSHHYIVAPNGGLGDYWHYDALANCVSVLKNPILSVDSPTTDPALNVEITRNMSVADGTKWIDMYERSTGDMYSYKGLILDTGDMIVDEVQIIDNSYSNRVSYKHSCLAWGDTSTYNNELRYQIAKMVSSFNYIPLLWTVAISNTTIGDDSAALIEDVFPLCDLKNYSAQNAAVIIRLHELSMLSLLYVPGVAKQVNYMNK